MLLLKEQHFGGLRAHILGTVWIEFDIQEIQASLPKAIHKWPEDTR